MCFATVRMVVRSSLGYSSLQRLPIAWWSAWRAAESSVARVVADALHLPLEILVVRKVRHPWQPEYAIGAVAVGAEAYVRARDGLTDREVEAAVALARVEAEALQRRLRRGLPQPAVAGRTVVLVDDGLATGATMIASARWARQLGAWRVVAAAPVAARPTVDLLSREADEVVCARTVDDLGAVGLWYADFRPVHDEDVDEILRGASAQDDGTSVSTARPRR